MRANAIILVLLFPAATGCGGAASRTETLRVSRSEVQAAIEEPREARPAPAFTGLMGGLDPHSVERAMEPRMSAFAACVDTRRSDDVPLGGRVRLVIRVATDGSVRWAVPVESAIGDRDAERCILDVARATRFRAPSGGEADVAWTFDLGSGDHLVWEARRVRARVARTRARIARVCGETSGVRVTAWVGARGRVLRAGASAPSAETSEAIDCVLESVRGIRMPDPRGRVARVTFAVE